MGQAFYANLILVAPDSDATINSLKANLDVFYATDKRTVNVELAGDVITVNIDGYQLYVAYSDEDHVLEESIEIADNCAQGLAQYEVIKTCAARFEMHGDPDFDMEYFNDNLYIQEVLEEFKGIFIFEPMNGEFTNL